MPYVPQIGVKTPPGDTVVWRYLDLPKLLLLLEQGALYFALIMELEDAWEAVLSKGVRAKIDAFTASSSEVVVGMFQDFSRYLGINCWHINEGESIAMWSLYTSWKPGTRTDSYGTAIKSNVRRLKLAFAMSEEKIVVGEVHYADHGTDPGNPNVSEGTHAFEPIFQKRTCYRHENELRASTVIRHGGPDRYPEHGILVQVELEPLIESITLCPGFPEWGRILLDSALSRAGINPRIDESDLLEPPSELGCS